MKIMVFKILFAAVRIPGFLFPFQTVGNIGRMGLFPDSLLHIPGRVTDFCPAVMGGHPWRGVGVNHGDDGCIAFNLYPCHLHHLPYMGFDEINLLLGQPILFVQLLVNVSNGLGPVNIGVGGEVLKRGVFPYGWSQMLCCF